ncbi:MAG: DUF1292 domain-containing protein [bacterium]
MSGNNGTENPRIIKTQDENGEVYSFELIDVLEFEGKEYGLLAYVEEEKPKTSEEEKEEEEQEVVIMRLSKSDDSYTFETIEDDEEFNKVISYLESETEEEE